MESWITSISEHAPYLVILGVILMSGFGLPIPEDVPILLGGYLAGIGQVNPWTMLPAIFAAVMGADAILFMLGRRYGHHVPRLPLLKRLLTPKRLALTEHRLQQHGGKFLFVARFLPGVRAPAMFCAGTFGVPYWKFLVYDGGAALLSVPTLFLLAYYFAESIEEVRRRVAEFQLVSAAAVLGLIGLIVAWKVWSMRRRRRVEASIDESELAAWRDGDASEPHEKDKRGRNAGCGAGKATAAGSGDGTPGAQARPGAMRGRLPKDGPGRGVMHRARTSAM